MKKRILIYILTMVLVGGRIIFLSEISCAKETFIENMSSAKSVSSVNFESTSENGMIPVEGSDVKDGVYSVEVESSSSMFRIVDAELTVENGNMHAVITLSGKGYLKLFMGTGEEAAMAGEAEYINYAEDADGMYTYEIPVETLNQELECAAFSKKKEVWYDRMIIFKAETLPADAILVEYPLETAAPEPESIEFNDGTYEVEVMLLGGSGRAAINSPARVTIEAGKAVAEIEWSSPNYDYMKVGEKIYYPINKDGNAAFQIPVMVWDQEMTVIADTTAMSTPHEITYTLTFDSSSIKNEGNLKTTIICISIVAAAVIISASVFLCKRKKRIS